MPTRDYDLAIVGGGILGLATALSLSERFPALKLVLLEKEAAFAAHQTGHNSGVIHSGVYYRPGSLKAALCVKGGQMLTAFCQAQGIPVLRCGKVIVAITEEEVPRLQELHRRGLANGVPQISLIGPSRLRELEPEAAGVQALHLPEVRITDYGQIAQAYAKMLVRRGVDLLTETRLLQVQGSSPLRLQTSRGQIQARFLINCAGLQADRLAMQSAGALQLQIIPFRGEYYELVAERRHLVRGLIYPVPDPQFPFLGVHLSPRVDGRVEAGPSAVLALKREGYRKTDLDLRDLAQMLRFKGFWKMARRHWKTGLEEVRRSLVKQDFVRAVQRLVPAIQAEDLLPATSGVRAQAVSLEGDLLDDFHVVQRGRMLHLCNAPSPAATASLAIGEHITELARKQFDL